MSCGCPGCGVESSREGWDGKSFEGRVGWQEQWLPGWRLLYHWYCRLSPGPLAGWDGTRRGPGETGFMVSLLAKFSGTLLSGNEERGVGFLSKQPARTLSAQKRSATSTLAILVGPRSLFT